MSQHTDDVLDDIDAALDDYVEWHGSTDSASWAADGSHQVDTNGHYYASDGAVDWAALYVDVTQRFWTEAATRAQAALDQWAARLMADTDPLDALYMRTIVHSPRRAGRSLMYSILDELVRAPHIAPEPQTPADPLAAIAAEGLRRAQGGAQQHAEAFANALRRRLRTEGATAASDTTRRHLHAWESPYGPRRGGRHR